MTAPYSRSPIALVINSHPAVRRALCERIRTSFANFQLREASSVADALCMLGEEPADVVLIEGDGHDINGLQATRAVLERAPGTSVIVMAGYAEPSCRSAANRAGAIAFVSKRAISSELMQVLSGFATL